MSQISFYFRRDAQGEVRLIGAADGVPEQLARLIVTEAARQIAAPGLYQAVMITDGEETRIDLSRLGDADTSIAVVQARRVEGEVELGAAWVDAGPGAAAASTEALASAAAKELESLPEGAWHRLALSLDGVPSGD